MRFVSSDGQVEMKWGASSSSASQSLQDGSPRACPVTPLHMMGPSFNTSEGHTSASDLSINCSMITCRYGKAGRMQANAMIEG